MSTHENDRGARDDAAVMSTFRYRQELKRTIRLFGSFAVAFSFISITTGIFVNYKDLLASSGPAGIWTWPVVTVGQILVALVFAELSARIPLTGYSYQWVTRLAGPALGWLTGWIAVCFLIIVVPSVDHAIASVLGHMLEIEKAWTLKLIVCGVIVAQALIHIFGVRLATAINSAAVFTEVLGMVGLVILLGVLACVEPTSADIFVSKGNVGDEGHYFWAFIMASLMGAYTIVGFESAANLSEETVDASRTVPRAIIWSVILSGVVGTLFLIVSVANIDNLEAILVSEYPLPEIIESRLGTAAASLFFVLILISIFACGLVIMASGSRLIYAMARDGVFPGKRLFRRVSTKTAVPAPAILLVLGLAVVTELFSDSLETLLAAAAVLPALIYALTVGSYLARRRVTPTRFGEFTLGRWGIPVAVAALVWLLAIVLVLTIPARFHTATAVSAGLCALGVLVYLVFIRGEIRRGEAGIQRMAEDGAGESSGSDR